MNKFINDLFTEADNETYDLVRVMGCISLLYFLILSTQELISHCEDFNLREVSHGVAMILASMGAGIGYKYSKEKRRR